MTRSHAGRAVRLNNMQVTRERWSRLRRQQDVSGGSEAVTGGASPVVGRELSPTLFVPFINVFEK